IQNNHPNINETLSGNRRIRLLLSQIPALYTNFCSFPPLISSRNVQRAIVQYCGGHRCQKGCGPACGCRKAGLKFSVLCLHCTGTSCEIILDQIVLDDDNAEAAKNDSDQIQDDKDQTDHAEVAEYGAELMFDDDNNERDSA
ncbi:hypothetical protein JTB14_000855, partial [Gonioctena quinquepunctata]